MDPSPVQEPSLQIVTERNRAPPRTARPPTVIPSTRLDNFKKNYGLDSISPFIKMQVTNMATDSISYLVQTGVSSVGQPLYSACSQTGSLLTTCSGTVYPNPDGTKSCTIKYATTSTGYPVYQITHLTSGYVTYTVQTGTNSNGQPIYSPCNQYGQLLTPTSSYYCSGTLVTNNDGTKSCVVKVGTCSTGYPIYQAIIIFPYINGDSIDTKQRKLIVIFFYTVCRSQTLTRTW